MKCPKCSMTHATAIQTYTTPDKVYRRRRCQRCELVFYTAEAYTEDVVDIAAIKRIDADRKADQRRRKKEELKE